MELWVCLKTNTDHIEWYKWLKLKIQQENKTHATEIMNEQREIESVHRGWTKMVEMMGWRLAASTKAKQKNGKCFSKFAFVFLFPTHILTVLSIETQRNEW